MIPLLLLIAAQPTPAEANQPCQGARLDRSLQAQGLGHDSFDSFYRAPFGAVPTGQGSVLLRFRTCLGDADQARLRVWDAVKRRENWITMAREPGSARHDPALGPIEFWSAHLEIPSGPTILYYYFVADDGEATHSYVDDDPANYPGGWGRPSRERNDTSSFQLTVYDRDYRVPDWFKGTLVYQILPDRFRNGDPSNDPTPDSGFVFGKPARLLPWSKALCDPRTSECPGESDNQFYGGDLQGVIEKLDELERLGVGAIYFNPIFLSSTNHRYDTQDYFAIDPELGSQETFDRLLGEARHRRIRVILDGVFNHGSADSPYFDVFGRWEGTGACESVDSPFRSWFFFPHYQRPPLDHARPDRFFHCAGDSGTLTTYESWWGYYEHPIFNKSHPSVRDLFFAKGESSVGPHWVKRGIGGWRLDVGGDADPGLANDPTNPFWEDFRQAVKRQDPEAVILGEEWHNATPWLLGREWDSATNYRFRTALLSWLSDGIYEDDDGSIRPLRESQFLSRLRGIQENYPPEAWKAMMNPLGSHDTQRALFVLKKTSSEEPALARRKLRLGATFQLTYPGSPVIYYGDEAGVAADGKFHSGRWFDDPYTRAVYPWEDQGADQGLRPDLELREHFARLGNIRKTHSSLRSGDFETVLIDDERRIFAFRRQDTTEQALVVLNRGQSPAQVKIPLDKRRFTRSAGLKDLLSGETFKIDEHGVLDCGQIPALEGRIFAWPR